MALAAIDVKLLQKSAQVTIIYNNGIQQRLDCNYLRLAVAPTENIKQQKNSPNITSINLDHDTISFVFNDGTISPNYSWQQLYDLGDKFGATS